jgi:hypothetical protein
MDSKDIKEFNDLKEILDNTPITKLNFINKLAIIYINNMIKSSNIIDEISNLSIIIIEIINKNILYSNNNNKDINKDSNVQQEFQQVISNVINIRNNIKFTKIDHSCFKTISLGLQYLILMISYPITESCINIELLISSIKLDIDSDESNNTGDNDDDDDNYSNKHSNIRKFLNMLLDILAKQKRFLNRNNDCKKIINNAPTCGEIYKELLQLDNDVDRDINGDTGIDVYKNVDMNIISWIIQQREKVTSTTILPPNFHILPQNDEKNSTKMENNMKFDENLTISLIKERVLQIQRYEENINYKGHIYIYLYIYLTKSNYASNSIFLLSY